MDLNNPQVILTTDRDIIQYLRAVERMSVPSLAAIAIETVIKVLEQRGGECPVCGSKLYSGDFPSGGNP